MGGRIDELSMQKLMILLIGLIGGVPRSADGTVLAQTAGGLQFAAQTFTAQESDRNVAITVIRTGDTSAPLSVNYATSDRSAIAGADYIAQSGTLTFMAGETNK